MERGKRFFNFVQLLVDLIAVYFSYFVWIYIKSFFGKPYSFVNILSVKAFVPYLSIAYVLLFFIYRLYEVGGVDFLKYTYNKGVY